MVLVIIPFIARLIHEMFMSFTFGEEIKKPVHFFRLFLDLNLPSYCQTSALIPPLKLDEQFIYLRPNESHLRNNF